jgi:hypothetical protein
MRLTVALLRMLVNVNRSCRPSSVGGHGIFSPTPAQNTALAVDIEVLHQPNLNRFEVPRAQILQQSVLVGRLAESHESKNEFKLSPLLILNCRGAYVSLAPGN